MESMVIWVVKFQVRGYKIGKLLTTYPKENTSELSKIEHHFSNKVIRNWWYQEKSMTKVVVLFCLFFNGKKFKKILMIFDIENWLWQSNFGTIWHLPTTPILNIQNFLRVCLFLGKNFVSLDLILHDCYFHNGKNSRLSKQRNIA